MAESYDWRNFSVLGITVVVVQFIEGELVCPSDRLCTRARKQIDGVDFPDYRVLWSLPWAD